MRNIKKTIKPDKVRTHSRYQMREREYKRYVKCSCGTPLILTSNDWTTCTCDRRYKGGYNMSKPYGQSAPWPTPLKRFYRKTDTKSYPVDFNLVSSTFNIGRHTKKLLREIEQLGGCVYDSYESCTDGRKRISTLRVEYYLWKPKNIKLEFGLSFNTFPENRSNKLINEKLRAMLADIREIQRRLDAKESFNGFNAPGATSEERVVVETMMSYGY